MKQLVHNGVLVPEIPSPHGLVIRVRGELVKLTPKQEEMALAWAKKQGTPYVEDRLLPRLGRTREAQEALNDMGGPLYARMDLLGALQLCRLVEGPQQQELGRRRADGQGVADLVSNPPRHDAEGREPVRSPKTCFGGQLSGQVPADRHNAIDLTRLFSSFA